MTERISPPADLEKVLDDLRADGVFDTKQKAMMFAVAVGHALGKQPGEIGKQGEGIRYEYFEKVRDAAYIDALAVTLKTDLGVLAPEHDSIRVMLFEQTAAVGLVELRRACYETGLKPLEGLLALVDQLRKPKAPLPGLEQDLDRLKQLI